MTRLLPDVALSERPLSLSPLEWVGMQSIDVPVTLDEPDIMSPVHARADVQVDLPAPSIKGIHMSRLYRVLDGCVQHCALSPASLGELLRQMVESHADCQSTRARIRLTFDLLCRRPALITPGLCGWKSYPVEIVGVWEAGELALTARVSVTYSSTCPCSAALSRQVVEDAFLEAFSQSTAVNSSEVAAWLKENASTATPHSQRSVAQIQTAIPAHATTMGLMRIIEISEHALGTPVQTAVKRADEQAFARLNGQNLMYVEDASRKVLQALALSYPGVSVFVSHLESLHPHDAVAWGRAGSRR
jgi:GTP cyclohydrolase I